jgi:riboflavin kinase/FMN adenylyltransferase
MKTVFGLKNLKRLSRDSAVTIGIFDGVHRAHAEVLRQTVALSRSHRVLSVCVTFWPHPKHSPFIYSLDHRLDLIAQLGFDLCVVISFTPEFARMTAATFVSAVLAEKLQMKWLVVGEDFRFGRRAHAGVAVLKRLAQESGFTLRYVKPLTHRGMKISSTQIRRYILQGKLLQAEELLGREVSVYGTVVRGWRVARTLGFPTANIDPHHEVVPPAGVYAVKARVGNTVRCGACYIGTHPTMRRLRRLPLQRNGRTIEVYLFDFSADIYRKELTLTFLKRLRGDKTFLSEASLAAQIRSDIARIRRFFRCP